MCNSRPPWITDLPTPPGCGQPVVPTGASVTHRSPAYALGLTRCACPGQRPAPPLRASPGGPTPRLLQSPFARPKQPKPGTVWSNAQLLPYNLRSATLARCATGHDRPESPVTIAGIRRIVLSPAEQHDKAPRRKQRPTAAIRAFPLRTRKPTPFPSITGTRFNPWCGRCMRFFCNFQRSAEWQTQHQH